MRKICVITTNRADYGILSNLISLINDDIDLNLQLIVSGSHLSKKFGMTINEITSPITKKIDIDIENKPSKTFSIAVDRFYSALYELKPDIVVILGDRYEIYACAIAAMFNNLPIAHIHGGETTQGAIDEVIRHSITKMSHIHFTSCEEYRKRVIQLGENPKFVFNTGALGVENIKKIPLLSKNALENSLDFKFKELNFLVTYHPVTLEGNSKEQFEELLNALDTFKDAGIIITSPNSDEGNNVIFELIKNFTKNHKNVRFYKSLGILRYLSAIQYIDAVIGNSSSGIIEVPSFKKPTINIGSRQKGRIQAASIINCLPQKNNIISAINFAISSDFSNTINPYFKENSAINILNILKTINLDNLLKKEFYDI